MANGDECWDFRNLSRFCGFRKSKIQIIVDKKGFFIRIKEIFNNLAKGAMFMKIHEYKAKKILKEYGISAPRGMVVSTPQEAELAAFGLGCPVVVKAQIHAGG